MKHRSIIFAALALMWAVPTATAQQYRIMHDDWQSLQINFSVDHLDVGKTVAFGSQWSTLNVDGYMPSAAVGAPNLPTFSQLIEVPLCNDMEVTVTGAVYDTLEALETPLLPVQPARVKSDTTRPVLALDRGVYSTDAYYGTEMAVVEAVGIARDRRLARLQFSPVSYNPVTGRVVVCRSATVTVRYRGVDAAATKDMYDRYHTPAFQSGSMVINSSYPKSSTNAPVRMLIVAHSSFQNQLDTFVQWKRRKGIVTDVVYTGTTGVGTTTTSIAAYIKSQYTNATTANPAPAYILLVGDVEQIPAFEGTAQNTHATDLYYATWTTGDIIPDCLYGRFSAQTVAQLRPQIDKTLMYEQYTFADPSFLDRAVMVAGVDGGSSGDYGYTHADPAMDYAIINYINGEHGWSQVMYFKNNTSIVPTGSNVTVGSSASSNSATVRNYYNQGAGWINYSAHGGSTGWGTPSFDNNHVNSMSNTQKFGIMIGNCCLTNKFDESTCFGEALLRRDNYCGAVGYIGGSQVTYWGEDFYWAVGVRSSISATMSMTYNSSNRGAYDCICHTHNESYSQWAVTAGELMYKGNMAVQSSTSGLKNYYWEIYHLMGDPSVMPYLTQASEASVTVVPMIMYGSTTLSVTTEPYAYVALTDTLNHTLKASGYANAQGNVTLSLPANLNVGGYELAVSAQQRKVAFRSISVANPTGVYVMVTSLAPQGSLDAGSSRPLTVAVNNAGTLPASDVKVRFLPQTSDIVITPDSLMIGSIAAGSTTTLSTLTATVNPLAVDGTVVPVKAIASWEGCTEQVEVSMPFVVNAPALVLNIEGDLSAVPGGSTTVTAKITNNGHAALPSGNLLLEAPTQMLSVTPANNAAFSIPVGSTVERTYTIGTSAQLPQGYEMPLHLYLSGTLPLIDEELPFFLGTNSKETFEQNEFHLSGWIQGQYPEYHWMIVNNEAYEGSYSARSYDYLTHEHTAIMTITCNVEAPDSMSFYYKVSSEHNYDKFHFYIDDDEKIVNSGEVDWTRAAYALSAGTHTFKFTYSKDYSVSNGSDCAWVDNILLPNNAHAIYFDTAAVCAGELLVVNNDTINTATAGSGVVQSIGADNSLTMLEYTVYPAVAIYDTVDACDHYTYNGIDYNYSTTIHNSIVTEEGCDSVLNLRLNIHYSTSGTIIDTVEADSYTWGDSVYTESGIYQQVFTSIYGCDSTMILLLTLVDTTGVGIEDAYGAEISVYPTPTTGMVHLSAMVDEVAVYDLSGRCIIKDSGVNAIDLGRLPRGTYMVEIALQGRRATCRVVKM